MLFILTWALLCLTWKTNGSATVPNTREVNTDIPWKRNVACFITFHVQFLFQDAVAGSTRLTIWKSKDILNYKDIKHIIFDRRTLKSASLFTGTRPHAVLYRTCAVLFWVFRKWNNFMEIICKMFLKFFCSLLFYESVKNLREALLTFYMLIFLSKENGGFLNFHI